MASIEIKFNDFVLITSKMQQIFYDVILNV